MRKHPSPILRCAGESAGERRPRADESPLSDNFEFPVQASVIPWLRACARRNGIAIEPVGQ